MSTGMGGSLKISARTGAAQSKEFYADDNRPYRSLNEKSPQRFNLRLGDYALIDHVSYN
jgi:hypothetical protein